MEVSLLWIKSADSGVTTGHSSRSMMHLSLQDCLAYSRNRPAGLRDAAMMAAMKWSMGNIHKFPLVWCEDQGFTWLLTNQVMTYNFLEYMLILPLAFGNMKKHRTTDRN